jgi:uncharacterized membrane protein
MGSGFPSMEKPAARRFDGLMSKAWDITAAAGVVGSGLIGGVFFTFSAFVMSGLNRLPARQATRAMQSINVTAQHPPLMLALFGTAIICGALAYRAISTWGDRRAPLLLAGAAVYLAGAILVTIAVNVPLNNQLAGYSAASPEAAAHWHHFFTAWLLANHVRAILSLAACALLATALLRGAPPTVAVPARSAPAAATAEPAPHPPVPPVLLNRPGPGPRAGLVPADGAHWPAPGRIPAGRPPQRP